LSTYTHQNKKVLATDTATARTDTTSAKLNFNFYSVLVHTGTATTLLPNKGPTVAADTACLQSTALLLQTCYCWISASESLPLNLYHDIFYR
jgi:hypothetical protein